MTNHVQCNLPNNHVFGHKNDTFDTALRFPHARSKPHGNLNDAWFWDFLWLHTKGINEWKKHNVTCTKPDLPSWSSHAEPWYRKRHIPWDALHLIAFWLLRSFSLLSLLWSYWLRWLEWLGCWLGCLMGCWLGSCLTKNLFIGNLRTDWIFDPTTEETDTCKTIRIILCCDGAWTWYGRNQLYFETPGKTKRSHGTYGKLTCIPSTDHTYLKPAWCYECPSWCLTLCGEGIREK